MPEIPAPIAEWLNSFPALDLVLTTIAIWVLVTLIWRAAKNALPGLKAMIQFFEALGRMPAFMRAVEDRLSTQEERDREQSEALSIVKHEVLPNNGGSLRDDVTTLGLRTEKIEAKLGKDHERLAQIDAQLTRRAATKALAASMTPEEARPEIECADSFNPYPTDTSEES